MSEFEKWYEENLWEISNYYDAKKSFEAGAQSKQAEIDELKQKYKALYDREIKSYDENLALKAHINELRCNRIVSDGEIDELRKQLELINQYTAAQGEAVKISNDERLELRKRIDFLENIICENLDERFLKGTTNER